jgi:hypothetical protein
MGDLETLVHQPAIEQIRSKAPKPNHSTRARQLQNGRPSSHNQRANPIGLSARSSAIKAKLLRAAYLRQCGVGRTTSARDCLGCLPQLSCRPLS